MSNQAHIDRRKQPQTIITAIGEALREIDWEIAETTNQRFVLHKYNWTNESFGYSLKIPKGIPIDRLWLGYLKHKDIHPPGIYAGMNPSLGVPNILTPRGTGYLLAPENFKVWILIKQLIPAPQIKQLEDECGKRKLKEKMKQILLKTYPFSLK